MVRDRVILRSLFLPRVIYSSFLTEHSPDLNVLLDSSLVIGNAQCIGNTPAVGRIGFVAVADMTDLDNLVAASHVAGSVGKEPLLFFGLHQSEQLTWLFVVVVVILTEVPSFDVAIYLLHRFIVFGLLLPYIVAVWLIVQGCSVIPVHAHLSVAVVRIVSSLHTFWTVYRNLVMVYPEAITLRITIREKSALQHFVG